jgi:hypothetical protein
MQIWHSVWALRAAAFLAAVIVSTGLFPTCARVPAAEPEVGESHAAKPAWIEGLGKDLRIKLAGEIVDEAGAPAENCKLTVTRQTHIRSKLTATTLSVEIRRNRFQVWAPVADGNWFNVELDAASSDGRRIGWETISAIDLRQAAIDGIKLTVKPAERFLDVTVVDGGHPVRGAFVVAELYAASFTAKTNDQGVARFPLFKSDKLSQLTAWADDLKVGGYSFYRNPPRDPSGSKFTIELEKCRPQVIRIIDEKTKAPLRDLPFVLIVGAGAPNYQFPGKIPEREMRTDENGEAVYRWFPDWKTHDSYISLQDPHWTTTGKAETVNGLMLVKARKSRFESRKRVVERLASTRKNPAGFYVEMRSYQSEEEHRVDALYAFTDANGAFAADYLPGSRYCIYADDERYVSNIIDLVPYDPLMNKTSSPSLTVSEGQPVEITLTSGPARTPVANQSINLRMLHRYAQGISGRQWWVTTDEKGKAHTRAPAGEKIQGAINTPEWQKEVTAEVKPGGLTRLEFHRDIDRARKITGRLLPAAGDAADLSGAVLEIGSLDGETGERMTRKTNAKGEFSFDSKASRIGIYARTKDAKAAAVAIIDHPDQRIELILKPTGEFHGRLLGKEDGPLAFHPVRANVPIGKADFSKPTLIRFRAASFEARTDQNGNYSFSGLPCETVINLFAASSNNGSEDETFLDEIYLVPHESRPRAVSRLWKRQQKLSFAERYERTLRDCRLSHFGAMVILFRPADSTKQFVDTHLESYATTREAMAFVQIEGSLGDESGPEIEKFATSKNWPLPENGKVFAVAMDPAGQELGRIKIDVKDPAAPKLASDFIRRYAPQPVDARKAWDVAFANARESGRKVWVRISQRYCGPCFELTRWLDDQKELLSQDYVFLKIDDVRDLHGAEVAERLPGSQGQGIPYFVIFDAKVKPLITSEAPLGNIGCPSGFEGKKHLRKMLLTTRSRLTDQQIDEIVDTLSD